MTFDYYTYLILPLLIFFARIVDVSIGTIRLIYVAKGFKYLAPVLGFFEVFVWIIAIGKLMDGVTSMVVFVAYAAGFAAGNFVGMKIEEKLQVGKVSINIIVRKDSSKLIKALKEENYPLTIIKGEGVDGKNKIINSVINRKSLNKLLGILKTNNPNAFYSVEDVRFAKEYTSVSTSKKKPLGSFRKLK